jgi:hypothetical protein
LNKTKFKDEMQKPHAAGNGKKNKVKKLQETYRYNEPIFLLKTYIYHNNANKH